ncbi:glycoside hydrolase, partial [Rhizodiscina lignyota]
MPAKFLWALAAIPSVLSATIQGFNYGSQGMNQETFVQRFQLAQNLDNTGSRFSAARLYTMIEDGTVNTPISAFAAAIATKTRLLLGIWCSAGQAAVTNEIDAFVSALQQYGSDLTDLLDGISVGSEDLYRISPTGLENHSDPGADPDTLVEYINQLKAAIAGTSAAGVPIGHVDTWTAWVNNSNQAVVVACDWIGVDGYPYWQTVNDNDISNAKQLFFDSYDATVDAASGKPVWVTETGWAVDGPTENAAVANIANAKRYWDEVGCALFGKTNVWWYTLEDAGAVPSFGIVGSSLTNPPLFDLTCPNGTSGKSVPSSSA